MSTLGILTALRSLKGDVPSTINFSHWIRGHKNSEVPMNLVAGLMGAGSIQEFLTNMVAQTRPSDEREESYSLKKHFVRVLTLGVITAGTAYGLHRSGLYEKLANVVASQVNNLKGVPYIGVLARVFPGWENGAVKGLSCRDVVCISTAYSLLNPVYELLIKACLGSKEGNKLLETRTSVAGNKFKQAVTSIAARRKEYRTAEEELQKARSNHGNLTAEEANQNLDTASQNAYQAAKDMFKVLGLYILAVGLGLGMTAGPFSVRFNLMRAIEESYECIARPFVYSAKRFKLLQPSDPLYKTKFCIITALARGVALAVFAGAIHTFAPRSVKDISLQVLRAGGVGIAADTLLGGLFYNFI